MRIFAQYVSLVLSLMIMLFALLGCKLKREKLFSNVLWFFYGLVGASFYVYILFFPVYSFDNTDLSAAVRLIHYTMLAVWLGAWDYSNWRKDRQK